MQQYICFLRGINVGGNNKILMKPFKSQLESWGFKEVTTYIQSGNILFHSDQDAATCEQLIKANIKKSYGFSIEVFVTTPKQLKELINNSPFHNRAEQKGHYFVLLQHSPSADKYQELLNTISGTEELGLYQNMVYLYCPNGYGKSKITNNHIEKKLGISATARNLKTMQKMLELSV